MLAVNEVVRDLLAGGGPACSVIVTGANGFVGRHVVAELLDAGTR